MKNTLAGQDPNISKTLKYEHTKIHYKHLLHELQARYSITPHRKAIEELASLLAVQLRCNN